MARADIRAKLETLIWAWPRVDRAARVELMTRLENALGDPRWADGPDWMAEVQDFGGFFLSEIDPDMELSGDWESELKALFDAEEAEELAEQAIALAENDAAIAAHEAAGKAAVATVDGTHIYRREDGTYWIDSLGGSFATLVQATRATIEWHARTRK